MSNIILGIDPDSKAHGVAVYENEKLVFLKCLTLYELFVQYLSVYEDIEIHIENVKDKKGSWHNEGGSKKSVGMVGQNIGKCKQSQIELERFAVELGVNIINHNVSNTWKSQHGKKQFEKVTGWKGRSNEDTRSAAWMGYLGLNK